jgi:poly(3-hydroxybutyrate) depolymerase
LKKGLLPQLQGRPRVSVSGLSSGADFAVQLQVAFSKRVFGSAIFAGQPYGCAVQRFIGEELEDANEAVPQCVGCPAGKTLPHDHCKRNPRAVNVHVLADVVRNYSTLGHIDDVANLARVRVYLYRGLHDSYYAEGSVAKTRDFFGVFAPDGQLAYKDDIPSGHAYPLPGQGLPWLCGGASFPPFQNCGYDGVSSALQHIYSDNLVAPKRDANLHHLRWFDQRPFSSNDTSFADWGIMYVPEGCGHDDTKDAEVTGMQCDLHVSLHGCGFVIQPTFELLVSSLNLNQWAEANRIVVVYPQLQAHGTTDQQRNGCWSVYGQTGDLYATRKAPQMAAVFNMVTHVAGSASEAELGITTHV